MDKLERNVVSRCKPVDSIQHAVARLWSSVARGLFAHWSSVHTHYSEILALGTRDQTISGRAEREERRLPR